MFSRSKPVYQPTTTENPTSEGTRKGYLASTVNQSGCCCRGGSRRRTQILLLILSSVFVCLGVVSIGVGISDISGNKIALVGLILLGAVLLICSGVCLVFYMRTIGRCNLPCWPSRAEEFSRTLNENNTNQVIVDVSQEGGEESEKLMMTEQKDAKIVDEKPPIVEESSNQDNKETENV